MSVDSKFGKFVIIALYIAIVLASLEIVMNILFKLLAEEWIRETVTVQSFIMPVVLIIVCAWFIRWSRKREVGRTQHDSQSQDTGL